MNRVNGQIEAELRRIASWDVGPNPLPLKLHERRAALLAELEARRGR